MEVLVQVALQCVEVDKDMRPTMGEGIELLLRDQMSDDISMKKLVLTSSEPLRTRD
ncbi:hypothetical protein SAY87_003093 [Trapa incisa]|uniref:Uncharacterized protein n=1 Tax=Trapa incisa TaxID=236973 RepID=A0AAN7KKC7_9MYRT|nr:hypothetical protein SAY87_003093 [Trapa incisa]